MLYAVGMKIIKAWSTIEKSFIKKSKKAYNFQASLHWISQKGINNEEDKMKIDTIEERLTSYINHVCADAAKEVDASAAVDQWHMIVGNDLIVDLKFTHLPRCLSDKRHILDRIMYRLGNNIPQNFRLHVCAPRLYAKNVSDRYSFCRNYGFCYEQALAAAHPFGEDLVLFTKYEKTRPSAELDDWKKYLGDWDNHPYERMKINGLNVYAPIGFDHFREVYVKTFGEDPLDVWIRMHTGESGQPLG